MSLPGAASLGVITFHGWRGWVGSIKNVVDIFTRIGEEGSGHQVVATRATPVNISAWIACTNDGDAVNACSDVEALDGTLTGLLDPWGRNLASVRVTGVSCNIKFGRGNDVSDGNPMTHVVFCDFTIELLP